MNEVFVKKYWEEEEVLFYIHFQNGTAVAQIEISAEGKLFLSVDDPDDENAMLYDQSLSDLDLEEEDFISKEEFEEVWSERDDGECFRDNGKFRNIFILFSQCSLAALKGFIFVLFVFICG
eukprot:gene10058-11733_t